MKFDVKIEGIKEVDKMLKQLPKDLNSSIQRDINNKAARIGLQVLKKNTPEGNSSKSPSKQLFNNVMVTNKPGTQTTKLVGFNQRIGWIAKFLEFGTKVRKVIGRNNKFRQGANRGKVMAKPFVLKSFEEAAPRILEFLSKNYLKIINASLKRNIRKLK